MKQEIFILRESRRLLPKYFNWIRGGQRDQVIYQVRLDIRHTNTDNYKAQGYFKVIIGESLQINMFG